MPAPTMEESASSSLSLYSSRKDDGSQQKARAQAQARKKQQLLPSESGIIERDILEEDEEDDENDHYQSRRTTNDVLVDLEQCCDESERLQTEEAALRHLNEAVAILPSRKKGAYAQAAERAPLVVKTESPPLVFLRCENYNAFAAARRLVAYWTLRRDVFGQERAILPLNDDRRRTAAAGRGAMSDDDFNLLYGNNGGGGAPVILLPHRDAKGRRVLCANFCSVPALPEEYESNNDLSLKAILRCIFYLFNDAIALEDPQSSSSGGDNEDIVFLLRRAPEGDRGGPEMETPRTTAVLLINAVRTSFPFRLREVHIVVVVPGKNQTKQARGSTHAKETILHVAESETDVPSMLERYGFAREKLPLSFGGEFVTSTSEENNFGVGVAHTGTSTQRPQHPQAEATNDGTPRNNARLGALEVVVHESVNKEAEHWAIENFKDALENNGSAAADQVYSLDGGAAGCAGTVRRVIDEIENELPSAGAAAVVPDQCEIDEPEKDASSWNSGGERTIAQDKKSESTTDDWIRKRQARIELQMALDEIPVHEKAAFLRATAEVPNLVATESDPDRFLRIENYDARKAARRLAAYWETRCAIFRERAYLPLDLTGRGALDQRDLEFAQTGFFAILPNASSGQSVLLHDRARLTLRQLKDDSELKVRYFFYMVSVISENEESQRGGFLIISRLSPYHGRIDHNLARGGSEILRVVPVRFASLVFCSFLGERQRMTWTETMLPVAARLYRMIYSWPTVVVVSQTREELLRKMEGMGFCKNGLPEPCGGDWSYDSIAQWLLERGMRAPGGGGSPSSEAESAATSNASSRRPQPANTFAAALTDEVTSTTMVSSLSEGRLTGHEERQPGQSERQHRSIGSGETRKNRGKSQPQERLSQAPAASSDRTGKPASASSGGAGVSSAAEEEEASSLSLSARRRKRKREMDVISSRKKRARQKVELQALREKSRNLWEENFELKKEGRFLEEKLLDAKKIVSEYEDSVISRSSAIAAAAAAGKQQQEQRLLRQRQRSSLAPPSAAAAVSPEPSAYLRNTSSNSRAVAQAQRRADNNAAQAVTNDMWRALQLTTATTTTQQQAFETSRRNPVGTTRAVAGGAVATNIVDPVRQPHVFHIQSLINQGMPPSLQLLQAAARSSLVQRPPQPQLPIVSPPPPSFAAATTTTTTRHHSIIRGAREATTFAAAAKQQQQQATSAAAATQPPPQVKNAGFYSARR